MTRTENRKKYVNWRQAKLFNAWEAVEAPIDQLLKEQGISLRSWRNWMHDELAVQRYHEIIRAKQELADGLHVIAKLRVSRNECERVKPAPTAVESPAGAPNRDDNNDQSHVANPDAMLELARLRGDLP
jgi:hypothetical protein